MSPPDTMTRTSSMMGTRRSHFVEQCWLRWPVESRPRWTSGVAHPAGRVSSDHDIESRGSTTILTSETPASTTSALSAKSVPDAGDGAVVTVGVGEGPDAGPCTEHAARISAVPAIGKT